MSNWSEGPYLGEGVGSGVGVVHCADEACLSSPTEYINTFHARLPFSGPVKELGSPP